MKRRILAFALALVLACSMSTVALAESKDVTVKVEQLNVYDTNINWGNLDFVYKYEKVNNVVKGTWKNSAGVETNKATITVTNNSTNAPIYVSSTMENKESVTGAKVEYNGDGTMTMLAAKVGFVEYVVSVEGEPENLDVGQTTVGTITVTIETEP